MDQIKRMVESNMNTDEKNSKVILWALVLCGMVIMMIIIGGVTRLTGSGLSIVEWKPLMGAIPPLTLEDWMEVFAKYQASPQYQLVNKGMSLAEFQWIYFWEYFHRLIGRLLGVVFFIPWIYFWRKGFIDHKMALKFLGGFLLGGLQGLMGWIMVVSGLVDQPHVSHFRLAAHLALAFFILAYFWRLIWELKSSVNIDSMSDQNKISKEFAKSSSIISLKTALNGMLTLLIIQIFYGAFVAGLRAGFIANTFPDMQGSFFPLGGWSLSPQWLNILENPLTVQWIHRILAWSLLFLSLGLYIKAALNHFPRSIQRGLLGLVGILLFQFALGVMTLILRVPLPLAVLHQVGAAMVLLYLLWLRWQISDQHLIQ